MGKYNENAAALTWEIVNGSKDMGKWELSYLKEDKYESFKGEGFEEFLNAAQNLGEDMNVIYTKDLRWLVLLIRKFINFKGRSFFANSDFNFYYIQIADNVELRNWDEFWDKVDDGKEFLRRLNVCRKHYIPKGQESMKGLDKGYKTTLAHDMWADEHHRYYLYQPWALNYCERLSPQTEDELSWMRRLDKAGFYYQNPDQLNKIVPRIHQYDISSAYLGYLTRKSFPMDSFTYTDDDDEIDKIVDEKYYCWYGLIRFHKLQWKSDLFHFELPRFGQPIEGEMCGWELLLTNVDFDGWFRKCFSFESCEFTFIYYAQQRPFSLSERDYIKMFNELYEDKSSQKKGTFAKEITKKRCQLPFGQPIKSLIHDEQVVYLEEDNDFEIMDKEPESLDQIKKTIKNRGLPYYVGLWVAAHSRAEFFTVLNKVGFDKVIYGDTDSIKFTGDEGIKVIEEHNKEIIAYVRGLNRKRNTYVDEELGIWQNEGDLDAIKAIGTKWYITLKPNGEYEIKASGANVENLNKWANSIQNPMVKFGYYMEVEGMFKNVYSDGESITVEYINKMTKDVKKEILNYGTPLYYYNPWEEKNNE